jgi:hypothetical protein
VGAQTRRFGDRAHGRDGRALAVGAGDVHDRRQPVLRTAKRRQQAMDAVEREVDRLRMQLRQTVEDRIGAQVFAAPDSLAGMARPGCGSGTTSALGPGVISIDTTRISVSRS